MRALLIVAVLCGSARADDEESERTLAAAAFPFHVFGLHAEREGEPARVLRPRGHGRGAPEFGELTAYPCSRLSPSDRVRTSQYPPPPAAEAAPK